MMGQSVVGMLAKETWDMTKVPSSALMAHLQPAYGTEMSTSSVNIMNVQIHTIETRSVLTLEQTD